MVCVFPVTCFSKGGIIFLFFEIILFAPLEVLFIKPELENQHFSVYHMMSQLVAPSFSLANSLSSADVLFAAHS